MVSFHRSKTSSTIPNILHNAYGIPHSTNGIPQQYWWYPHQYWATSKVLIVSLYRNEHSPHYWRYFFTVLMVSLYIDGGIPLPNSTEHPQCTDGLLLLVSRSFLSKWAILCFSRILQQYNIIIFISGAEEAFSGNEPCNISHESYGGIIPYVFPNEHSLFIWFPSHEDNLYLEKIDN